jgi:hypothetical protein
MSKYAVITSSDHQMRVFVGYSIVEPGNRQRNDSENVQAIAHITRQTATNTSAATSPLVPNAKFQHYRLDRSHHSLLSYAQKWNVG